MYDVTREELVAAVEAEEREWLSTEDDKELCARQECSYGLSQ